MDEAERRLSSSLTPRQCAAVAVLARQRAIAAVKAALQRQGLKPQYMPRREIVAAANEYLAEHRAELINEAREIVERWQAEGFFGKQRCAQRASLTTSAQTAKA